MLVTPSTTAVLAMCGTIAVAPTVQSTSDLRVVVAELRSLERSAVGLESVYDYAVTIADVNTVGSADWTSGRIVERQRFGLLALEASYFLKMFGGGAASRDVDHDRPVPTQSACWTGAEWRERRVASREVRVAPHPPSAVEFDVLSFFAHIDSPTFVGGWSVTDILSHSHLVEVRVEGDREILSMWLDRAGTNRISMTLLRSPRLCVEKVVFDIYGADGDRYSGQLKTRYEYHVAEWMEHEGLPYPSIAYRDAYLLRSEAMDARGRKPVASRSEFKRLAVTRLDSAAVAD